MASKTKYTIRHITQDNAVKARNDITCQITQADHLKEDNEMGDETWQVNLRRRKQTRHARQDNKSCYCSLARACQSPSWQDRWHVMAALYNVVIVTYVPSSPISSDCYDISRRYLDPGASYPSILPLPYPVLKDPTGEGLEQFGGAPYTLKLVREINCGFMGSFMTDVTCLG